MESLVGRLGSRVRRGLHRNDAYLGWLDWRAGRSRIGPTEAARRSQGGTDLHRAVAGLDVDGAAALLAGGVDVTARDAGGHAALDRGFARPELVHAVRQRYQATPWPDFRAGDPWGDASAFEQLSARGIVRLPGFVPAAALGRLQADFAAIVASLDERLRRGEGVFRQYHEEEHFWPRDGAYVTNNAFKHSEELILQAVRDEILALARRYFGKPVHVQRAGGLGYLPGGRTGHEMFTWHHDLEGRRLKLMLLLTEIGPRDHTMGYVAGSHRIGHPWHRFQQNRLSLGYCARHLDRVEIVETVGSPGDAWVFDSNGAHMGNRRADARRREVFMVEYNSDPSNVYGGDVPAVAFERLGDDARAALALLRGTAPRWTRPSGGMPTWVETLYDVDRWLARPPVAG